MALVVLVRFMHYLLVLGTIYGIVDFLVAINKSFKYAYFLFVATMLNGKV